MNYEIKKFTITKYQDIKKIYLNCFDKENRFSIMILLVNIIFKRANMYMLLIKNEVVAFIYLINDNSQKFILYLAVKEKYRNKGIGTYLLKWYLSNNKDNEIYLNIDEINEKYDDCIIRKKRLDFYIRNNFYNTNYLSVNGCSIGHILSNEQKFNVEKYKLFDKKISRWFLCKNDEIKKLCNK